MRNDLAELLYGLEWVGGMFAGILPMMARASGSYNMSNKACVTFFFKSVRL